MPKVAERTKTDRKPSVFIKAEEFVTEWQKSATSQQVADKFGIDRVSATSRASAYRKRGIELKTMSSRNKLNVHELNKLAKQVLTETR